MPEGEEVEVFLGDGLYAGFDGFYFTLRAPRANGDHWVALDPAVLRAFDAFRKLVEPKIVKEGT